MRYFLSALALTAILQPAAAEADDITDALSAALEAYEEGDIQFALEEIAYATQLLNALKAEGLQNFLPEPLPGWTREITEDAGASLGFMGGGIAAEAEYTGGGDSFQITMMADNQMVASLGAMLGNSALIASLGQLERINRESFVYSDGELQGLVGNRVLIQARGGELEDMIAHLEQLDFRDLADFDQ